MQVSRDVITAEDWANESSLSERGRIGRFDTLKRLLRTNGETTFAELLEDIRTEKVTVYSVCKKFVDTMRKDGLKPSVVYVHRSRLPELFESVLGEENFKRTTFNRLVPRGDNYVSTKKAIPTWGAGQVHAQDFNASVSSAHSVFGFGWLAHNGSVDAEDVGLGD